MPLKTDLAALAITLPLDVVLTLAKAAKGQLDEDTTDLLFLELTAVLCEVEGAEQEVVQAILRDALGVTFREPDAD